MYSEMDDMPSLGAIPENIRTEYFRLFNMVKPHRNWKQPICATVTLSQSEINMMREAIATITGSREITFDEEPNGTFKVKAEGYYNAMCPEPDFDS